jgi:uncharacterized protein involved in propanediol utilization
MCNLMYDCSMLREHAFSAVAQGARHMPPYVMMVFEASGPLQTKSIQEWNELQHSNQCIHAFCIIL